MNTQPEPLKDFVVEVESYLARTGVAAARFGKLAVNDPSFVIDLRDGREPRFSTIEKARAFMREHPNGERVADKPATCATEP